MFRKRIFFTFAFLILANFFSFPNTGSSPFKTGLVVKSPSLELLLTSKSILIFLSTVSSMIFSFLILVLSLFCLTFSTNCPFGNNKKYRNEEVKKNMNKMEREKNINVFELKLIIYCKRLFPISLIYQPFIIIINKVNS